MSFPSPTSRTRLTEIAARLSDWKPGEVGAPPEGYGEAAVSIVLRATEGVDLLLIRRSKSERDPWSGHMALPGGRRDATDTSLLHTAIRETREETAVELEDATILGRLALVSPTSERLPKLSVTPIVFGIEGPAEACVNSHEIGAVHWASLEELQDPTSRETTTILLPDGPRDFPCFRLDGQIVWGLTHRILDRLVRGALGAS
jgi:8-oxo-dGTP pyrophosphatase MutT (NUDIX family)